MTSTDEFRLATAQLFDAADYRDVFREADERAVKATFRAVMRSVHPDVVASSLSGQASAAVNRLTQLHDQALAALQSGTFGSPRALLVLESPRMRHECMKKHHRFFDMTAGYVAHSYDDSGTTSSIVKIAKSPRDNELLTAEADALTKLANTGDEHSMFYPALLDSFALSDGPKRLRANALAYQDGFVNLEQVHDRYPIGLAPLDMAWIWRRVLWALGGAHETGVLHGALVPSHIMIHPALHGVVLVDWCYSVQKAAAHYPALQAIVGARRDWYPKTVLDRQPPTETLDLSFAARSMRFLMGAQLVPEAMQRYFASITSGTKHRSAYELLRQFDLVLERLGAPYYPRTFRPLNW